MKIKKFQSKEEWLKARDGKITGSTFKDVLVKRGTGQKIGFYKLIAQRLAIPEEGDETALDRGVRLEDVALDVFEQENNLKVNRDLVIWERDDNESIALSPDGFEDSDKPTWAVEVKCLAPERHIEAIVTKEIPKEYEEQKLQYFIVNDDLQKLYFVMYDPRVVGHELVVFEVNREEVQDKIDEYIEYQRNLLEEVDRIVRELSF